MFDQFYGLTGRPFQLTPDPAFYFESLTHRKALSYLGYGLAQGEGFIVITGEVGAGKSTLVAHLMATIDPARLTAAQIVTSSLDGEEIVHVVAQAFGLPIEGHDKASALGAIEGFLHEEARAGRRCLLIVDESQNLAIGALEELRMLSNFQLGAHPLLQTLLLGQPEFRDTLSRHPELDQLRQRVIATHHLEAMGPEEVEPYIEHRLGRVGWTGNPGFDKAVFAELYAITGGVPRRINQLVNRLLLLGAIDERSWIDGAVLHQLLQEMELDGSITLIRPAIAGAQGAPVAEPAPAAVADAPLVLADWQAEVPAATPHAVDPAPAEAGLATDPAALERIEHALADRDSQIAELQQAVLELASAPQPEPAPDHGPQIAALDEQIAALTETVAALETRAAAQDAAAQETIEALRARVTALESRIAAQDETLRQAITMLIDWLDDDGRRVAA